VLLENDDGGGVCVSKPLNRLHSCLAGGRELCHQSDTEVVLAKHAALSSLGTFSVPIPQKFKPRKGPAFEVCCG